MKTSTSSLIAITIFVSVGFTTAEEPRAPESERVDLYGDPLPAGALARLGTLQMRLTSGCDTTLLPDGKSLVITGPDHVMRSWDIVSGKFNGVRTVGDGDGPADSVTLSFDGKTMAILKGAAWTFWDVESNKPVGTWKMSTDKRHWPIFWDGQLFAVLRSDDHRVLLWDRKTGTDRSIAIPRQNNSIDSAYHACISPDRRWLVGLGGHGQPYCVYDLATGSETHRLPVNASTSTFAMDSKQLVICDTDWKPGNKPQTATVLGTIRFFDLLTGKEVKHFSLGESFFHSLAISRDGEKLSCCLSDRSIVMNTVTGSVLHRFPGRPIWSRWALDGQSLITSDAYRLHVWDTTTWKERFARPGEFDYNAVLAFSPDGRYLASAGWMTQTVMLWEARSGKLLRQLPLKGDGRYVRSLNFAVDGHSLVASQMKNYHQWWDVETGREIRELTLDEVANPRPLEPFIIAAKLSPDGKRASVVDRQFDRGAEFSRWTQWDTAGKNILAEQRLAGGVRTAVWLDDGNEAIFALPDGMKRMRVADGQTVWHVPNVVLGKLQGTPDGQLVAAQKIVGEKGNSIGVWEALTGTEVATIKIERVDLFALTADLRHLVTIDATELLLWDLAAATIKVRHSLPDQGPAPSPHGPVSAVVVSPDGRRAFTSFRNGSGLIWDLTLAKSITPRAPAATQRDLETWWADLGSDDGRKAYNALWRLGEAPQPLVLAFLREHLSPVAPADEAAVIKLIAQLGDDKFAVREKACRDLEQLGPLARPSLRRALRGEMPAEARRRAADILDRSPNHPTAEALRALRAIQLLASADIPAARQHLAALAHGAPEHPITKAAKAAVERPVQPTE